MKLSQRKNKKRGQGMKVRVRVAAKLCGGPGLCLSMTRKEKTWEDPVPGRGHAAGKPE